MEHLFVLSLFALLGPNLLQVEGVQYQCNDDVIEKIKAYWGDCYPENIIDTCKSNGKEIVVRTTSDYFSSSATYIFFQFNDCEASRPLTSYSGTIVFDDESSSQYDAYVVEYEGTTFEPCSNIRRYHVYQKGGVTGVYCCVEDDAAECGDAEGFVKVASDYCYDSDIENAVTALQNVGVNITVEYPTTCP